MSLLGQLWIIANPSTQQSTKQETGGSGGSTATGKRNERNQLSRPGSRERKPWQDSGRDRDSFRPRTRGARFCSVVRKDSIEGCVARTHPMGRVFCFPLLLFLARRDRRGATDGAEGVGFAMRCGPRKNHRWPVGGQQQPSPRFLPRNRRSGRRRGATRARECFEAFGSVFATEAGPENRTDFESRIPGMGTGTRNRAERRSTMCFVQCASSSAAGENGNLTTTIITAMMINLRTPKEQE